MVLKVSLFLQNTKPVVCIENLLLFQVPTGVNVNPRTCDVLHHKIHCIHAIKGCDNHSIKASEPYKLVHCIATHTSG